MSFVRSITRSALPLSLLFAGFVASTLWLTARDAGAAPPAGAVANEELEQVMRQMNGAAKALSKGITKDNRDESLELIVKIEHALVSAKTMIPDAAATVEADKRDAYVAEYRKALVEALKVACDAEIAVLDGQYDVAEELVKTKLAALKKAGHDKFQVE